MSSAEISVAAEGPASSKDESSSDEDTKQQIVEDADDLQLVSDFDKPFSIPKENETIS
jgi:hypothetical protein